MKIIARIFYLCLAGSALSLSAAPPEGRTIPETNDMMITDIDGLVSFLQKRGAIVGYQDDLREHSKFEFSVEPKSSLGELLEKASLAIAPAGIKLDVKGRVAMLTAAGVKDQSASNPLDAVISDCELKNVGVGKALSMIADTAHIKVLYFDWSVFPTGSPVTMKLHQITVRDALFQIVSASGLSGWTAKIVPKSDTPALVISFTHPNQLVNPKKSIPPINK